MFNWVKTKNIVFLYIWEGKIAKSAKPSPWQLSEIHPSMKTEICYKTKDKTKDNFVKKSVYY